jgi:hypothetical protein
VKSRLTFIVVMAVYGCLACLCMVWDFMCGNADFVEIKEDR